MLVVVKRRVQPRVGSLSTAMILTVLSPYTARIKCGTDSA
jgi:hypothetical protein